MDKKKSDELVIANKELAFQNEEKEKRAAELIIANKELAFQNEEKKNRAAELVIANKELAFQNEEKKNRAAELVIANKELAFQNEGKKNRAAELVIANKELAFQNEEKENRAEELVIANKELAFQNEEKENRAEELVIANKELAFQNEEKENRAAELVIANKELVFQNEEKEKRAEELVIANKELAFQNEEKENRAAELVIANKELVFQNEEKEKRAEELIIANKELAFQNEEKEKRAEEKEKRAEELIIANKELAFQNEEKEKRAEELIIANKELAFQNEEKEKRAEELIIANKELAFQNEEKEKRAVDLVILSGDLKAQQEELRRANDELHEKAEQLTLASKYKSEFLANMSHELRTPLNSLLILAQQLFENHEGNLTDKQIGYAKTIHTCGDDLTQLINDILDLSKIESGVISAEIMTVSFMEIASFVGTTFKPIAETKNLNFEIDINEGLPEIMETDIRRLNQILKNLLSNAFKFTEKGEVKLRIYKPENSGNIPVKSNEHVIAFSIDDTGIGISRKTQGIVFEAFQQAEGSTSRKYGGTGLGLSISKGFAELLGGTIVLQSEIGKGSTFTLYLPLKYKEGANTVGEYVANNIYNDNAHAHLAGAAESAINDDRHNIAPGDKVILVIEDDVHFAKIIIDKAHDLGLKAIVAVTYLEMFNSIKDHSPIAITLDVNLPESNGWKLLKLLKNDLNLRHIPVHLISGEENRVLATKYGAQSFHLKPLSNKSLDELLSGIKRFNERAVKSILVIESGEKEHISKLLENGPINVSTAPNAEKAILLLKNTEYDCIVLDFSMPDAKILLDHLKQTSIGVILHSEIDPAQDELIYLKRLPYKLITKSSNSDGNLLDELFMLLHVNTKSIPQDKMELIHNARGGNDIIDGKKVLIVDDDVRNLFALTAAFESSKLEVITAESGKEALEILNKQKDIDIVLIDIMMPEMDGYETIQWIRKEHRNKQLPIIAVTAKAMTGDRQKCIASGASDYITKPVKTDQLLLLMRVWLYQ
jgi:signal transduction histidine kinase/CheY-like chemotaxis protein